MYGFGTFSIKINSFNSRPSIIFQISKPFQKKIVDDSAVKSNCTGKTSISDTLLSQIVGNSKGMVTVFVQWILKSKIGPFEAFSAADFTSVTSIKLVTTKTLKRIQCKFYVFPLKTNAFHDS